MRIREQNYILLGLFLIFTPQLYAQRKSNVFYSRHHAEVKAGTGAMLGVISLGLNDGRTLDVPSGEFAFATGFNYKYFFTPHFATGPQFDYIFFSGKVLEENTQVTRASTSAMNLGLTFNYYFKSAVQENYRFNYTVYYKLGVISLSLGKGGINGGNVNQSISISDVDVGLLTGLGLGVHYILNEQLALVWTIDYNHVHNSTANLHRLDKLFSETPYTVSHSVISSIGLNFRFKNRKKRELEKHLPFYEGN